MARRFMGSVTMETLILFALTCSRDINSCFHISWAGTSNPPSLVHIQFLNVTMHVSVTQGNPFTSTKTTCNSVEIPADLFSYSFSSSTQWFIFLFLFFLSVAFTILTSFSYWSLLCYEFTQHCHSWHKWFPWRNLEFIALNLIDF